MLSNDEGMAPATAPFAPTPQTDEEYEAARVYLKREFASWGAKTGVKLEADAGESPIHYKYHYLDGHLTRWTCADLDQIYLQLHPAKVIVDTDELDGVLAEASAFMRFLADAELLDPTSDGPGDLADHIAAMGPAFRENMADTSRFSVGKALWSTAMAEGVELDDEASVQSIIQRFNARPRAERDRVFGHAIPSSISGRATPPGTRPRQARAKRKRRG